VSEAVQNELASLGGDERWELVHRLTSSRYFQRSPRLREFLIYVTERTLRDRLEEVHEQQIGCHVYGKPPDYNASEDNIVRVDARRLRKALADYFAEEGRDEPIVVRIPKGSYIPVFERRESLPPGDAAGAAEEQADLLGKPLPPPARPPGLSRRWFVVAAAAVAILAAVSIWQWREIRSLRAAGAASVGDPAAGGIWSHVFDARHQTQIVVSDVGFSILQNHIGKRMSLRDYLDRRYAGEVPEGVLASLSRFKLIPFVDSEIVVGILQADSRYPGRSVLKHPRDVRLEDFREGHHILIGSRSSNPWCELFADQRNFSYEYDLEARRSRFRNVNPRPGEQAVYYNRGESGQTDEQYGVVALLPNLSHTGKVLIIEGTTISGTETAWEFVRRPGIFSEFAAGLKGGAGEPAAYFEVLLRTHAFSGASTGADYVAHRILRIERPVPPHP
jgi:hypothetical protein